MTEPTTRTYSNAVRYRHPPCSSCGKTILDREILEFVVCHHCGRRVCRRDRRGAGCAFLHRRDPSFWRHAAGARAHAWHCEDCLEDHHRLIWLLSLPTQWRRR